MDDFEYFTDAGKTVGQVGLDRPRPHLVRVVHTPKAGRSVDPANTRYYLVSPYPFRRLDGRPAFRLCVAHAGGNGSQTYDHVVEDRAGERPFAGVVGFLHAFVRKAAADFFGSQAADYFDTQTDVREIHPTGYGGLPPTDVPASAERRVGHWFDSEEDERAFGLGFGAAGGAELETAARVRGTTPAGAALGFDFA